MGDEQLLTRIAEVLRTAQDGRDAKYRILGMVRQALGLHLRPCVVTVCWSPNANGRSAFIQAEGRVDFDITTRTS